MMISIVFLFGMVAASRSPATPLSRHKRSKNVGSNDKAMKEIDLISIIFVQKDSWDYWLSIWKKILYREERATELKVDLVLLTKNSQQLSQPTKKTKKKKKKKARKENKKKKKKKKIIRRRIVNTHKQKQFTKIAQKSFVHRYCTASWLHFVFKESNVTLYIIRSIPFGS